jgi:hypothetical protein
MIPSVNRRLLMLPVAIPCETIVFRCIADWPPLSGGCGNRFYRFKLGLSFRASAGPIRRAGGTEIFVGVQARFEPHELTRA